MKDKIIHQIWFNFTDWGEVQPVPDRYTPYRASWQQHNPDWAIWTWTEKTALVLLKTHYPEWLSTWLSFSEPIQRADFFRWVALYHCGGCYVDMDCKCTSSLDAFLDAFLSVDTHLLSTPQLIVPQSQWAMNALIVAPLKKSPLIYQLLNQMKPSTNPFLSTKSVYGIFHSSGPAFVYKMLYNKPGVVFSGNLLWHVPGSIKKTRSCLAQHDGHGSWNFSLYLWNDLARLIGFIVLFLVFVLLCMRLFTSQ
jgi:hypothetical protein